MSRVTLHNLRLLSEKEKKTVEYSHPDVKHALTGDLHYFRLTYLQLFHSLLYHLWKNFGLASLLQKKKHALNTLIKTLRKARRIWNLPRNLLGELTGVTGGFLPSRFTFSSTATLSCSTCSGLRFVCLLTWKIVNMCLREMKWRSGDLEYALGQRWLGISPPKL